jgi:hypothetical protein
VRFSLPRTLGGLALLGALLSPLLTALTPAAAAPTAPPTASRAAATVGGELGYDRLTLRRSATWYLQPDLDGGPYTSYVEETPGWTPVAGDTDGDGTETLSLFRDGIWLVRDTPQGASRAIHFGAKGDLPVVGDWNGDGVDSLGLFRKGHWYLRDNSTAGPTRTFTYGLGTDLPVVGDWDGNGATDIAVVRNKTWYQRDSSSGGVGSRSFAFGNPGDRRFAGDWDHDGRDSPGVFRSGSWFFRQSNFSGRYTTTQFGRAGDTPLVRRTSGLAPGVTHRVVHDGAGPFTEHIATIDLAAASSPDAALAGNRLRGLQATSTIGRQSGAVLAINGDYFLSTGRPVHAFSQDGRLVQTPQLTGRALGLDATGTRVSMGFPDARATLTTQSDTGTVTTSIPRWNSGPATGDSVAAFTAAGAELETPPNNDCYAGLAATGNRVVHPDGGVEIAMVVTGNPRCGGDAPVVQTTGVVLDGSHFNASGSFLQSLRAGQAAQLTESLGFPGSVDVLGGTPVLILGGVQQIQDFYCESSFCDRQPRTALGVTADGHMLLVVVDGRQPGYSVGMTLQELADLMQSLGAVNAINLDGGGSSTMWVNGMLANRPSDGSQRGVGNALVVVPGGAPGPQVLRQAAPSPSPSPTAARTRVQRLPAPALVSPVLGGEPVPGWAAAAADPGSIGGLSAALAEQGVALPPDLQRARTVYVNSRSTRAVVRR